MAHIEDRWMARDPETKRRRRTDRYGTGLRWRVEWVDGNGQKRRKSFENKDLADKYLTDVKAEMYRGVYRNTSGKETLREVAEQWRATHLNLRDSSHQAVDYRLNNTILPSLGHKKISTITTADVQSAVANWSLDLAPSTVRVAYGHLGSLMKYAAQQGIIPASPCVKVRLPRMERQLVVPLSDQQVMGIADAIQAPMRRMVLFAAATGLRGGELRGLTWDRVKAAHIKVDRQLVSESAVRLVFAPPKTDYSVRSVAIGPATMQLLEEQRAEYGEGPERLVFHSALGGYTRKTMADSWRTVRRAQPFIGDGWHMLRHTHASKLIAAGMSPIAVAHRLGHKDATEVLTTYGHMFPDEDQRMALIGDDFATPHTPPNVTVLPSHSA